MLNTNKISNVIIFCLSLWALYVCVTTFWGVTFYFPFVRAEESDIPFHRLQSVRIAVLLTFAYFGFIHLTKGSEPLYPIQFLSVFLKSLVISALPIFYLYDVETYNYSILFFFFVCALILHLASKPKYKKYFYKK